MKTKLPLILMALLITGCQPKSEVDKCVEAKVTAECVKGGSDCKKLFGDALGGIFREQCLRAQAGKE